MNKQEFINELRNKLLEFPKDDVEECVIFYSEMIDDRMEEGNGEEEAVSAIGSVDEIVEKFISDLSFSKIAKEKIKPKRRLQSWEVALIILGSPIWFSLLISFLSVVISLYLSSCAVLISFWAVFVSLVGSGFGCMLGAIACGVGGKGLVSLAIFAVGLVCISLSIFVFFGCKVLSEYFIQLTRKMIYCMKKRLIGKEGAQ